MRAIIWLMGILLTLFPAQRADVVVIPPMPQHFPTENEYNEKWAWSEFHADAFEEYANEFTVLFNSYTYKLSKNGRSMINGKFVAMPKESAK